MKKKDANRRSTYPMKKKAVRTEDCGLSLEAVIAEP
jgi:hypothetical protein